MAKNIKLMIFIFTIICAVQLVFAAGVHAQTHQLQSPAGICISSTETSETIYVTDKQTHELVKYSNTGQFMEKTGESGSLLGQFNEPHGLSATSDGNFLYLADKNNNRIQKIKLNCMPDEVDRFVITTKVYDVNSTEPLGFKTGNSTEEGGYIELTVKATLASGETNETYNKPGKLFIDEGPGMVTWEGKGISCDSAPETTAVILNPVFDTYKRNYSGGAYDGTGFSGGVMLLYVRCTESKGDRNITVLDAITGTKMSGTATVNWTQEDTPPALSFIGANKAGFRKYTAKNDPGVTFIKISASTFDRGDGTYGGTPTEIKMSTYYIAETPTTNAQFKKWRDVVSTGMPVLAGSWNWGTDPSGTSGMNYPDHPAVYIPWSDARNYSYWLITGSNTGQDEKYIMTEAQYEKAARGAKLSGVGNNATDKLWPWGNTWDSSKCNSWDVDTGDERRLTITASSNRGTTIVTKYSAQGYFDLYDLSGNVLEWGRELYSSSYPAGIIIDPIGTTGGPNRVLRVGSFGDYIGDSFGDLHSSSRSYSFAPSYNVSYCGIRPCFYWPVK